MRNPRSAVRDWIPPIVLRVASRLRKSQGFFGDYPTWGEAMRASSGYDAAHILEKVKGALLKVKRGQAIYERDSVLFDRIEYSWPLLTGLLWVASLNENRLSVLDFGGSLGSSYFQNRQVAFQNLVQTFPKHVSKYPSPNKGNVRQFQKTLYRAIFAIGTVENGENNIESF